MPYLKSLPVTGNLGYLSVDPVNEPLVALLQQPVSLVQHEEPTLSEPRGFLYTKQSPGARYQSSKKKKDSSRHICQLSPFCRLDSGNFFIHKFLEFHFFSFSFLSSLSLPTLLILRVSFPLPSLLSTFLSPGFSLLLNTSSSLLSIFPLLKII